MVVVVTVYVGIVTAVFVFVGFTMEDLGEVYSPAGATAADTDGGIVETEFPLHSRHSSIFTLSKLMEDFRVY